MTELGPGKTVFDLGQNFAGVPYVRVRGIEGQVLKLTPGELLNPDGSVSQGSSGGGSRGAMWWTYTLSGSTDGEDWEPQFGYYGFRYLQAEWSGNDPTAKPLTIDEIKGVEWHSASPVTGSFESSSAMLNAIHALIVSAMHNNEVSLFTDCPHREKLGWLEETHLVAPGLMFNNDLRGLYAATEKNISDAQYADGLVADDCAAVRRVWNGCEAFGVRRLTGVGIGERAGAVGGLQVLWGNQRAGAELSGDAGVCEVPGGQGC
jgi:alpha-L-rhamnosidase